MLIVFFVWLGLVHKITWISGLVFLSQVSSSLKQAYKRNRCDFSFHKDCMRLQQLNILLSCVFITTIWHCFLIYQIEKTEGKNYESFLMLLRWLHRFSITKTDANLCIKHISFDRNTHISCGWKRMIKVLLKPLLDLCGKFPVKDMSY